VEIAPALATGIRWFEAGEFTPLTPCVAEISQEAGLPAGVVNIVTETARTGEALVKHPDVDKIAFTGSTEWTRDSLRHGVEHKRLSLELEAVSVHRL